MGLVGEYPVLLLILHSQEAILREAWESLEKLRYRLLLDIFSGSRNLELNEIDVETKDIDDLQLEQHMVMGDGGDGCFIYLLSEQQPQSRKRRRHVQPHDTYLPIR